MNSIAVVIGVRDVDTLLLSAHQNLDVIGGNGGVCSSMEHQLTNLFIFTESEKSESDGYHAGVCKDGDSFIGAAEVGICVVFLMSGQSI
jgi:hypothetical protein